MKNAFNCRFLIFLGVGLTLIGGILWLAGTFDREPIIYNGLPVNLWVEMAMKTATWLGWNTLAPAHLRFDPFPAFVFWLFMSNMVQIFLMPLIMIGQNLQSQHAEARAEADFEINQKAEMEIETVLMHLENQDRVMQQILQEVEKIQSGSAILCNK